LSLEAGLKEKMEKSNFSKRKKMAAIFLVLTLAATAIGYGEEGEAQKIQPKTKSEEVAMLLSAVGFSAPILYSFSIDAISDSDIYYLFAGYAIGPSLGYFYGGLPLRGLLGIGVRTLSGLLIYKGFLNELTWAGYTGSGWALIISSGIVYLTSALFDWVTVGNAVKRRNERIQTKAFFISPIVIPQKKVYGISAGFQF